MTTGLPAISLTEALEHPDLFAGSFRGSSWKPWKAFIATLFGEPLVFEALALYRHHTDRTEPPVGAFREAAMVCGRRGGKSRVLALLAVYVSCFRDYRAHLAPGEQPVVALIAADRKQARVLIRYIGGLLREVPLLKPLIADVLAETIRLTNGVVIEVHTASITAPRGRTFVAILADEIAFWPARDDSANPDSEVIASVRPGLASIPNSLLLMASSPYWQKGVLWNTFRRHFGVDDARVLVWRGTTAEMNDTIDPAVIAEAFEDDPASAAAEFGAEFRVDIDTYASREVIEAAVMRGVRELPPVAGLNYVAFVDPSSGAGGDRMVLAIAHAEDDVAVLDCLRGFAPPFAPDQVVAEFAEICHAYGITSVRGDRWGLGWVGSRFEEHGERYDISEKPKSDIYRELLGPLNSSKVQVIDHAIMIGEALNLERRVARGGRDSIDHPRGLHDDYINAAAGALMMVSVGSVNSFVLLARKAEREEQEIRAAREQRQAQAEAAAAQSKRIEVASRMDDTETEVCIRFTKYTGVGYIANRAFPGSIQQFAWGLGISCIPRVVWQQHEVYLRGAGAHPVNRQKDEAV